MFDDLILKSRQFTQDNATEILTGVGVTGTITVAYLSGKASIKAFKLIAEEETRIMVEQDTLAPFSLTTLTTKEKIKLVWPIYVPTIGTTGLTVASIVLANRLSSKKAAALAAAYGLSERAFSEYKDKVAEHLTKAKEVKIREEIAQDRVDKNPVSQVIITGAGDVLCYDSLTGRYFESNIEAIKKAMNTINYRIMHNGPESLSAFYDEIGLPPTSMSDELGWNSNDLMDILFSTTMSTDERPCIAIDFTVPPTMGYARLY